MRAPTPTLTRLLCLVASATPIASAGCDSGADPSDLETVGASLIADGSPEALGLLGFLNAAATTVTTLDTGVALDSRAAKALIAHRDGADKLFGTRDDNPYDNVAEVDAIAYVGTAAMDKLVAYCRAHDLIPSGAAVLGTYDDVLFTIDEGTKTLALANTASATHLDDDLLLDSRAVRNIVAARPIASVLALSKLSYVGTTALRILKTAASSATTLPAGATVAAHLGAASQGLLHTSESDYPFVVVRVPGAGAAALTAANVKSVIAGVYVARSQEPTLTEREVEVTTLAQFFDRYTIAEDWWEDSQVEQAPAFAALRQVFEKELVDVQVFRLGRKSGRNLVGAIDVFIIGRTTDGEVVGLSTISVET